MKAPSTKTKCCPDCGLDFEPAHYQRRCKACSLDRREARKARRAPVPRVSKRDDEKRRKVRDMRIEGMTYQQIGEKLGISRERARQLLVGSDVEGVHKVEAQIRYEEVTKARGHLFLGFFYTAGVCRATLKCGSCAHVWDQPRDHESRMCPSCRAGHALRMNTDAKTKAGAKYKLFVFRDYEASLHIAGSLVLIRDNLRPFRDNLEQIALRMQADRQDVEQKLGFYLAGQQRGLNAYAMSKKLETIRGMVHKIDSKVATSDDKRALLRHLENEIAKLRALDIADDGGDLAPALAPKAAFIGIADSATHVPEAE